MTEQVAWEPQMSVGVDLLDSDHKKLIDMFNRLLQTDVTTKSRDDLIELLANLREYTHVHFTREEELMARQNYPDLDSHKATHRYFVEELEKLFSDFDHDNTMMLRVDLILLLKDWFIEHVQSVDAHYKPYMATGI